MKSNPEDIQWNLGHMIEDVTEEKLKAIVKEFDEQMKSFTTKYSSFLEKKSLQPSEISHLLTDLEDLTIDVMDLITFGRLSFATNSSLLLSQTALHFAVDIETKLKQLSTRFQHKINEVITSNPDLLKEPILQDYNPFLKKEYQEFQHQLDLQTEELLIEKDRYGIEALTELRDKWLNNQVFPVTFNNKTQKYSYGEMMGLLHDPNEKLRAAVIESLYTLIERDQEIYSTVFRSICSDWVSTSKRRKFSDPLAKSLLSGNVELQPIENLMQTMDQNVELYQRYLKLKAEQLNIPALSGSDLFAPPKININQTFSWDQAKQIVLDTYYSCDQELGKIVQYVFDSHHIDASPRQGKTNGAFCDYWLKGKSAFVLLSFNGNLNDIYTLAHELGHAVHGHYIFRKQKLLNANAGAIVSEIASKFGELILTDYLLDHFKTSEEKIQVLSEILDFNGYSMFWGSLRFWFEKSIYEAVERNEFLDGNTINKYYTAARDKVYRDTVIWPEKTKWEWITTPHYYITDLRYYNYPYIFALIFVYNCFQIYKTDKKSFIPKFKAILEAGGSMSPQEIASHLGFDINDPKFWENGLQQYSRYTNEFKSLIR